MLFGYKEAEKNKHRFYEFHYLTFVKRTEQSKNFRCFEGNNDLIFTLKQSVYFNGSEADFQRILINDWNTKLPAIYFYQLIGKIGYSYSATEVVERIYKENNHKFVPQITEVGIYSLIS